MSDYPLSARSSKKAKTPAPPAPLPAPPAPLPALPADHSALLQGERIFIELYAQGRVVATEYSRWV